MVESCSAHAAVGDGAPDRVHAHVAGVLALHDKEHQRARIGEEPAEDHGGGDAETA
jgi:hypothetical protein